MTDLERIKELATWRAQADAELRAAIRDIGKVGGASARQVAAAAGLSHTHVWRMMKGEA